MRNQALLGTAAVLGLMIAALAAVPLGAAPQGGGGMAVIDNVRVFEESNQGRAATQQIQANVESWQQQIATIETRLQGLMSQRQQQAGIMTAEALRSLDLDIEQNQIDLQRMRDDAQRQAAASQALILGELDGTLTPIVRALAAEMGFSVVFNSETPGLLYYEETADITDTLIARLNAVGE